MVRLPHFSKLLPNLKQFLGAESLLRNWKLFRKFSTFIKPTIHAFSAKFPHSYHFGCQRIH